MCNDCSKRGPRGFQGIQGEQGEQGLPGDDGIFAGYLVYQAVIKTQTGTNVPDDEIISDTIEGVWTRTATGTYRYTKNGAFGASTTFFTFTNGLFTEETRCRLSVDSSNYITLKTYNSSGVLADDLLEQAWIGIYIKP